MKSRGKIVKLSPDTKTGKTILETASEQVLGYNQEIKTVKPENRDSETGLTNHNPETNKESGETRKI